MKNLNKEIPIKDYKDIIAGVRGYYRDDNFQLVTDHLFVCEQKYHAEIENTFYYIQIILGVRMGEDWFLDTYPEEANFWAESKHFYYWARIVHVKNDYCLYIKAYNK